MALSVKEVKELVPQTTSIFANSDRFELVQRAAKMFATATMLPDHFRGNIGNVAIALNLANRLNIDEFMLMQQLYVIHGKPGIESKLQTALIEQSGKYSEPLTYQWLDGEDNEVKAIKVYSDATKDERGCRCMTKETKSGKAVLKCVIHS